MVCPPSFSLASRLSWWSAFFGVAETRYVHCYCHRLPSENTEDVSSYTASRQSEEARSHFSRIWVRSNSSSEGRTSSRKATGRSADAPIVPTNVLTYTLDSQHYDSVFKVAMLDRWMVVACGPALINDIKARPESELSAREGAGIVRSPLSNWSYVPSLTFCVAVHLHGTLSWAGDAPRPVPYVHRTRSAHEEHRQHP